MIKVMLKKQFLELFARMFRRSAMGKKNSKANVILYGVLFAYLFGMMGFLFYNLSSTLCTALHPAGLTWLYFALLALIATALGVVGSVFAAYSALYQARDNELLLSMPIPPRVILFSRMVTVYLMAFCFEAIVWLPAALVYALEVGFTPLSVLAQALILFLLPLLSTVLACVLGWLLALIFAHVRNSQMVTLVFSLGFLGAYFYLYSKLLSSFGDILTNIEGLAPTFRSALFPFYHLGLGAQGKLLSLLLFALFALALFTAIYAILSASFLKLTTTRKGAAKVRYQEKAVRRTSPDAALLRREFARFTGSATYMLNGGLGVIFLLILPIFAIVKRETITMFLPLIYPGIEAFLPLVLCAAVAAMSSMNCITAPSVSLEGRSIWLAQSLPVTPWQVLRAKFSLHILIVAPATLFCALVLGLVLELAPLALLLVCADSLLFVVLCALFGLFLNLKLPNLDWTNETVPVKQGLSVLLAMFVPWGGLVLLGLLCYALRNLLSAELFLLLAGVIAAVLSALLLVWLKKRGAKIFASL